MAIGTLAVLSISPEDSLYGEWSITALIFTLPVSIISFAYRYAESNSIIPVIIIQFVMFILTYFILVAFIKKKE